MVGNYNRGETLGLAADMGVKEDTIEDLAHAYTIYSQLCELDDGKFRQFVRNARRSPYIYYSHFRALYDAKSHHKLTDTQVLEILMDVVQAEGGISSRGVDGHIISRFGDTRGWEFWGKKAAKELSQTLQQPDLPNVPEVVGNVYYVSGSIEGKKYSVNVIAANPQRAMSIAKKALAEKVDEGKLKKAELQIRPMGEIVTDSKNLLNIAHVWLGDKS